MKNFLKIFIFLMAIGHLAACKTLPSAVMQDASCSPPCWNGIIPGKTLLRETDTKLKTIPTVDPKSLKMISILQTNDGIYFKILPGFREEDVRIFSQGGIVESIDFGPRIGTLLLLSEFLQNWGSPDRYIAIYYSEAETPYLTTYIIYSERGIVLLNMKNMSANEVPKFDSKLSIDAFWLVNPPLINALLENGGIDRISDQDILEGIRSWSGLQKIDYLKRQVHGLNLP